MRLLTYGVATGEPSGADGMATVRLTPSQLEILEMDEKTAHLLEQLKKIPKLSWETPQLLNALNGEGVTLAKLDAGMGEIQRVIEVTDTHYSQTNAICRKLMDLPPRTIPDGIPIGF